MVSGIGSFQSAFRNAASSYAAADRANMASINRISSSDGMPSARSGDIAALARSTRSQIVNWDNSAAVNGRSLDKIDRLRAVQDGVRDINLQMKDLIATGMNRSNTQAQRDEYVLQILDLKKTAQSMQDMFTEEMSSFTNSIRFFVPNLSSNFYVNSDQLIVTDYGGGEAQSTRDWARFETVTTYIGYGYSANAFSNVYNALSTTIENNQYGYDDSDDYGSPDNDRTYVFSDSFAHTQGIGIAKAHAEKMSETLQIAINRMTSDDMAAESQRQAQTQLDKQRAMSAMNIANQAAQAYTQLMGDARANVGRLANFYI